MTARESSREENVLCAVKVDDGWFGIESTRIREVVGLAAVTRVPLAPKFVAGMISYRGEILTVVSLRALLGLPPQGAQGCLLVLEGRAPWRGNAEPFGLLVDDVGGVVEVGGDLLAGNAPALGRRLEGLCKAAYRTALGLLVQLDPEQLAPGSHFARQEAGQGSHTLRRS